MSVSGRYIPPLLLNVSQYIYVSAALPCGQTISAITDLVVETSVCNLSNPTFSAELLLTVISLKHILPIKGIVQRELTGIKGGINQ
jgi:hypothetical protein